MVGKDSLSAKTKFFRKHKLGPPEEHQVQRRHRAAFQPWIKGEHGEATGKELAENE